jgi:PhnB protein
MKVTTDYQTVVPYLILANADRFVDFTCKLFDAEKRQVELADEDCQLRDGEIKIGDSILMYCEATESYKPQTACLYIHVENVDETYSKSVMLGATSIMEPSARGGCRNAGIIDPCGNTWWITSVE